MSSYFGFLKIVFFSFKNIDTQNMLVISTLLVRLLFVSEGASRYMKRVGDNDDNVDGDVICIGIHCDVIIGDRNTCGTKGSHVTN